MQSATGNSHDNIKEHIHPVEDQNVLQGGQWTTIVRETEVHTSYPTSQDTELINK